MNPEKTIMKMPCDERKNFPTISVLVQNYWLEIPPEDYIINSTTDCLLGFMPNQGQEYWILGDSFFRGYYTIHDDENSRLGIVPHSNSHKSDVQHGQTPSKFIPTSLPWTAKQQIEAGLLGTAVFFLFLYQGLPRIIKWCYERKQKKDKKEAI